MFGMNISHSALESSPQATARALPTVLNVEITNAQVMRQQHLGHLSFSKFNDDYHETTITSSNGLVLNYIDPSKRELLQIAVCVRSFEPQN
jgi:hypothetical protein